MRGEIALDQVRFRFENEAPLADTMADQLSFFGLGKLGLPLAALFARSGLHTIGVDTDADLVHCLTSGNITSSEPGLLQLLAQARDRLAFVSDAADAQSSDASIILVPTPSDPLNPAFSATHVLQACADLSRALRARPVWRYHLIIIASTLFPGALSGSVVPTLERALDKRAGEDFGVAYVPEFVALGQVVRGYERPSFLLVGSADLRARTEAVTLYRRIVEPQTPIRCMPFQDAELAKVAFNAFLCTKISFGNFLAQLCDRLGGADIDAMAETFGLDPRIGRGLLRGGAPFGGTCLPRDIQALVYLSETLGIEAPLPQAVAQVNAVQYNLIERYVAELEPRCVGILGLSFKSDTSVTIGSPGFEFIRRLLKRSISVVAFDPMPQARDDARHEFGSDIVCSDTVQDCIDRSDTLLLCNADPAYAELPRKLNHSHRIVDPWGCVQLPHPVLIQTGRRPIGSNQPSGEEIPKITE